MTALALTMIAAAIVSTPPLFIWCMGDLSRRA